MTVSDDIRHPDPFIDNRDGNTLDAALDHVLHGRVATGPAELAIATGFFTPAGLVRLAPRLNGVGKVRLLFGAEPPNDLDARRPRIGETKARFEARLLAEGLSEAEAQARAARDRYPFDKAAIDALKDLIARLRAGGAEARRYEERFLHAKAYIYGAADKGGVIAGSANLTRAGLISNLEASLLRDDPATVAEARSWFDDLWTDAVPFDLAGFLAALFDEYSPFEIYIRMLFEVYGAEVDALDAEDDKLPLTTFQKHGVARALRIMRDYGGVIVADEVGLGKTFIAGEIMGLYHSRRQRVLLICPAALRDETWKKFLTKHSFDVSAECLSYEQLADDRQLGGDREHLQRPLNEYQLVVVDEAHNYRNPASQQRAGALRRLLMGQKRDLLLLTATPVNNSLWDLYHAIRYFIRQDSGLSEQGVLSLYRTFRSAMAEDPANLNPDHLYPVIDATCVKRTRPFIKKHYAGDKIKGPDGVERTIVFPKPQASTIRYPLIPPFPELFDEIEKALDPHATETMITFARYGTDLYLNQPHDEAQAMAAIGLLRSGLLKRFESSTYAFRRTLAKMIGEHEVFLEALKNGSVVTTQFLREWSATDDEDLDSLLGESSDVASAEDYRADELERDVARDLETLKSLLSVAERVTPENDPKLMTLAEELKKIKSAAEKDFVGADDQRRARKVLIFSFFSDTVEYVRDYLREACRKGELAAYNGRIASVSGSGEASDVSRHKAVAGFAPISTEATNPEDLFDILVTTDVLAEGVNLQDCRNIINFDVPWNPMRLVQRHGRIDRIGSKHDRVFLRTVFPAGRLDQLLSLEGRILAKIAMAARSVGVTSPVSQAEDGAQVFAETREEIERLLREDPTLYERGGTKSAAQTGEEYRQTLRKALAQNREKITSIPWKAGSGMLKGDRRGVVFCARVSDQVFFRFTPATADWRIADENIETELAVCLRLAECTGDQPRHVDQSLSDARIFELWESAASSIVKDWNFKTDPKNIQPRVDRLNREVAEYLRKNAPEDLPADLFDRALDILETQWSRRDKNALADAFHSVSGSKSEKARALAEFVLGTGLEPYRQPILQPPISENDVELVCWLAINVTAPNW